MKRMPISESKEKILKIKLGEKSLFFIIYNYKDTLYVRKLSLDDILEQNPKIVVSHNDWKQMDEELIQ